MVFITAWARAATSFCLLMALILTAFLLSGSTNETTGVRALYNIELKWAEPTTTTSSTATTTPASVLLGVEAKTPTATTPQKTTTRSSTRVATSTVDKESLAAKAAVVLPRRGLVGSTWATPASWGGESQTLVVRDPAEATRAGELGKVGGSMYEHEHNFERRGRVNIRPSAGEGKRPHLAIPRAEHINNPTIHQILRPRASSLSSNTTILISYFGLCTYTPKTQWHCTSRRDAADPSSQIPPHLRSLSKALQKTLSPLPPILTIISLGLLLLTTIALAFVKPLQAAHRTILGQVYLGVGLLAVVAGVFSAVLFYQSGLVVFAVLDGMQVGGGGGVTARKGGSGIAVAWAAVLFEVVGFLCLVWLVLCASEDASTDRDGDGGCLGLSIFSRVFGRKKDGQDQELGEDMARGRNSPAIPEDVRPALRGGDITISAPMEVRREVHPLRGNFQREGHPPLRVVGGERGRERVLSASSVSSVSALSDSSSVRGADGGRQESTISTVSDVTTIREVGGGGRGRMESERMQNLRRGNSPFPGGWNMI
ncbi:hypothetical protein HOY80DRAFT_1026699 [Tuber brumale]|nr:hypothetical protein HOY80DRAFT_1026699 [Tuber brumale]